MKIYMLICISLSMFLVSCGDNGSSSSSTGTVREAIFSDSSVTSFTQTGGVASHKSSILNYIVGSAYAVSGNIRCVNGASVSFELDALGNTVQVDTTCNSNIDLSIRQGLLESMAGKRLIMYHAGGGNALSQNRAVIFNASGSFWTTYENINAGGVANCKDKLTFDQATGTVTIENDSAASITAGATVQDCLDSEFVGATAEDYKNELKFRFKDGKLEMHGNDAFPNDADLVQWCIDQNSDSVCD